MGFFVHNYLAIPAFDLEIHPGRFFYGTHHNYGAFKNRSYCVKSMQFCKKCVTVLLKQSENQDSTWWYPIMNCETLTRGLTQHLPLSIQTILITGIFTTFILGIEKATFFIVTIIFILMLLIYNNTSYKLLKDRCVHIT
nr:ac81-like protein [Menippe mercenaria nudivirus]